MKYLARLQQRMALTAVVVVAFQRACAEAIIIHCQAELARLRQRIALTAAVVAFLFFQRACAQAIEMHCQAGTICFNVFSTRLRPKPL